MQGPIASESPAHTSAGSLGQRVAPIAANFNIVRIFAEIMAVHLLNARGSVSPRAQLPACPGTPGARIEMSASGFFASVPRRPFACGLLDLLHNAGARFGVRLGRPDAFVLDRTPLPVREHAVSHAILRRDPRQQKAVTAKCRELRNRRRAGRGASRKVMSEGVTGVALPLRMSRHDHAWLRMCSPAFVGDIDIAGRKHRQCRIEKPTRQPRHSLLCGEECRA